MATPPVRTFFSGELLTLLARGLAALALGPAAAGPLPGSFGWFSTGPLIGPDPDAGHPIVSTKDPTALRYKKRPHVRMTTADGAGARSLAHMSFADRSLAAEAPTTFLGADPDIGNRYGVAPQVVCFAPQKRWYMVNSRLPCRSARSTRTNSSR
ncbi:hypothetical protein ACIF85_38650 [Streptomyces sp. NPDC086033]|uniref:hypothetical protein n=1 Tax=Streptomyces sp. NPDC086033 TaxID=3365747 RepID=UPI0037D621A5